MLARGNVVLAICFRAAAASTALTANSSTRRPASPLNNKAVPLVFIGYNGNTAAYRLLDPAFRKIVCSRDGFVEHEFPLRKSPAPPSAVPQPAAAPAFDLVISPGVVAANAPEPHTPAPPAGACAIPPAPARAQSELLFRTPPPVRPHPEAMLAQVEAMLAGIGDSLAAADNDFALPSSDPRNHREAARNVDSDR
ncbi:hypothetical protein JCM3770_002758 [Rhodotorula araucariae]